MADNMRGRFVWHELMTPDPKAAVLFYGKVAGWTPKPYDKNPDYTMLTYNGMRMGGVLKHDAPRLWLPYIASPNVDVTAREAVELGGEVVKPAADIPDVGRFAMIKDPQSAMPKGPGQGDCQVTNYKLSGSTASYTMTCKEPPMTAEGEMKYSGTDAYTGVLKVSMNGQMMNITYDAKRIGDCPK